MDVKLSVLSPPVAERFCAENLLTGGARFNPYRACLPSRSEFSVIFSETSVRAWLQEAPSIGVGPSRDNRP